MILESAQLLCGVFIIWLSQTYVNVPYKLSHKNHPCSIWARENISNYLWLCELGLELCKEYTYRYGRRHKSQDVIEWCIEKPSLTFLKVNLPNYQKRCLKHYKVDGRSFNLIVIIIAGTKKSFFKMEN